MHWSEKVSIQNHLSRNDKLEIAEALVTRLGNGELTEVLFGYDLRRLRLDREDHAHFMVRGSVVHNLSRNPTRVGRRDVVSDVAREEMDRAWLQAYLASRRKTSI